MDSTPRSADTGAGSLRAGGRARRQVVSGARSGCASAQQQTDRHVRVRCHAPQQVVRARRAGHVRAADDGQVADARAAEHVSNDIQLLLRVDAHHAAVHELAAGCGVAAAAAQDDVAAVLPLRQHAQHLLVGAAAEHHQAAHLVRGHDAHRVRHGVVRPHREAALGPAAAQRAGGARPTHAQQHARGDPAGAGALRAARGA
jgi:hypothetical protein